MDVDERTVCGQARKGCAFPGASACEGAELGQLSPDDATGAAASEAPLPAGLGRDGGPELPPALGVCRMKPPAPPPPLSPLPATRRGSGPAQAPSRSAAPSAARAGSSRCTCRAPPARPSLNRASRHILPMYRPGPDLRRCTRQDRHTTAGGGEARGITDRSHRHTHTQTQTQTHTSTSRGRCNQATHRMPADKGAGSPARATGHTCGASVGVGRECHGGVRVQVRPGPRNLTQSPPCTRTQSDHGTRVMLHDCGVCGTHGGNVRRTHTRTHTCMYHTRPEDTCRQPGTDLRAKR